MPNDLKALTERFLKDQIRIMKKHGKGPNLGTEEYRKLVEDTQRSFRGLSMPAEINKEVSGQKKSARSAKA
jgi:hypothetical protein